MKVRPLDEYVARTGRRAYFGLLASESQRRLLRYAEAGCNNHKSGKSAPLSFWLEDDILRYIKTRNLPHAAVYGDMVDGPGGKLVTTGYRRTGCVFCCFWLHLEDSPNRFERLAQTHPKLHAYVMDVMGLRETLDWLNRHASENLVGKFNPGPSTARREPAAPID